MKVVIKKKNILVGCFIILLLLSLLCIRRLSIFRPQSVVTPAISKDIANGMLKENEGYIVRITDSDDDEFNFSRWYYMEGTEKKPIFLIGQRPIDELSYIFMEPERNSFFVKGHVEAQLSIHHNMLVLFVEEWHLIDPIKRDYGRDDYRQEQRFFYPRNYLDEYDVEQGDYDPANTYDLIWDRSGEYYLKQEGYYKIRSRWNGSELEWFLIYDDIDFEKAKSGEMRRFEDGHVEKKISIEGNSPEYLLGATILNNGYDNQYCSDFFIVNGELKDNEDGVEQLEIYKWWINKYFTHKDNSGNKIRSSSGFNQSDIEAGIYKSYR